MSARPDSIPVKVLKVNADNFVEKIILETIFSAVLAMQRHLSQRHIVCAGKYAEVLPAERYASTL